MSGTSVRNSYHISFFFVFFYNLSVQTNPFGLHPTNPRGGRPSLLVRPSSKRGVQLIFIQGPHVPKSYPPGSSNLRISRSCPHEVSNLDALELPLNVVPLHRACGGV